MPRYGYLSETRKPGSVLRHSGTSFLCEGLRGCRADPFPSTLEHPTRAAARNHRKPVGRWLAEHSRDLVRWLGAARPARALDAKAGFASASARTSTLELLSTPQSRLY